MNERFDHGYALLIGVGAASYPDWSLPATVRDMQALRKLLVDPALCAYPADDQHVRLLHDAGATRQSILAGLAWLAERAAADPEATAVVFYSGHGWVDKASGRYYLIPHDVVPFDIAGSALAADDFNAALQTIAARRLLVFIDSCHAEGMATAKTAPAVKLPAGYEAAALPKTLVDALQQGEGRAVFTSSRGHQSSWVRADGTLSVFIYHLLEALQGAGSLPGDTVVRVSDLMNHLDKTVPASALKVAQAEQHPFFNLAAEDFAVALLRGGKGLPAGGWQDVARAAGETIRTLLRVEGDRNVVAGGDLRNNVIITGDNANVRTDRYV